MYKTKGQDPGGTARYFGRDGVGWYTYIWCGGCAHTAQPCNVVEARSKGWAKRKEWGWLCDECLVRLGFKPASAVPPKTDTETRYLAPSNEVPL